LLLTPAETLHPLRDNRIFIAQRTDSIVDVWKGLIRHNFSSVPVMQKNKKKFYGFVDVFDIVKFFIEFFGAQQLKEADDFWAIVKTTEGFEKRLVNDIMVYPLSLRNPFKPVPEGYSLFYVVELLARERGLHRVPIIDRDQKLVNVVTQSQVIKYLANHMAEIGTIRNKPIIEMEGVIKSVHSIKETATAMDAFSLMVKEKVSGIAIVNDKGKITANISLKDLKGVSAEAKFFWRLLNSAKSFADSVHEESKHRKFPITVQTKNTLEDVITTLVTNNVHHVYIVDDEFKPIGVMGLREVLLQVLSD